ncbi:ATP-binding protein [Allocoprobacillus halotolerans]|uniref:ATP-binding protein n=1 Tax=Allocoprobacillus halotolerans TaxID=2944914 RepID=A0ABY5I479_9FIRM|nr:AAA family ATPase [Allocoprobacillus halotolerans]UTY40151.1 ATP-binding protein [Allocoprobacillus halotolerans]
MGIYLNPDNIQFLEAFNKEIYVDKSLLIQQVEYLKKNVNKYICVSRPRRFGKSTDANMLVAYYSKGCDSSDLFNHLKISQTEQYEIHLNNHNVFHLNMQDFLSKTHNIEKMIALLAKLLFREIKKFFSDVDFIDSSNLVQIIEDIYAETGTQFIFIIDEWDCIFREYKNDKDAQKTYLDFLRNLLKDKPYVELAYMTGILPIKKYGTHSALNMFEEISMIDAGPLPEFMGLTETEVENLCLQHHVSYDEMKQWYDGYQVRDDLSTFSPQSVISAIVCKKFGNYWTSTETYEALQVYIDMNFDGLKDDVIKLLAGENVPVQTSSFQNDMTTLKSKDDVLTLLIHLGYLGYNDSHQTCYIPNKEVIDSFVNSIRNSDWKEPTKALLNSQKLLEATCNQDEEMVAKYIEEAHLDTSILTYNNENALAYTLSIAYIYARNHYTIIREMPTGKGFADMVFIPYHDKPAMIVELKWKQDVQTAITQIKEKKYPKELEKYKDNLLIVEITYDPQTKKHTCHIEKNKSL